MTFHTHTLEVATRGKGLVPITREVARWIASLAMHSGNTTEPVVNGLLTLFIQHTSASLVIQENADPDVILDLADFFEQLAPEDASEDQTENRYRHTTEGPDDMPAHIRAALTNTSLSLPVVGGRMALGTWQGIYVFEHRAEAQRRRVVLQLMA